MNVELDRETFEKLKRSVALAVNNETAGEPKKLAITDVVFTVLIENATLPITVKSPESPLPLGTPANTSKTENDS